MFTRIDILKLIDGLSNLKKDLPEESHELIDTTCKYIRTMYATKGNIDVLDPSGKILVVTIRNDIPRDKVKEVDKYLYNLLGDEYKIVLVPSDIDIMSTNIRGLNNIIDNLIKVRDSILNDTEARR